MSSLRVQRSANAEGREGKQPPCRRSAVHDLVPSLQCSTEERTLAGCNFENDRRGDSRFREVETCVRPILYRLARLLQLLGMILLPIAIAGNLSPENPLSLKASLLISGAGIAVFIVGWLLQQTVGPQQ
jgi:hypothetical protein